MAIQYDYYKNPPRNGDNGKPLLHPRPVVIKTLKTEDIAARISARCSFTSSDLKGILDSLGEELYDALSDGYNIYLEGIGTFSLSLQSRFVENINEIRAASLSVKDINYRADKELKHKLKGARFERVKKPVKRYNRSETERFWRIGWYVDRYGSINISATMKLNSCTHKTAKADLQKMVEEGFIKKMKFGQLFAYIRQE